MTVQPSDWLLKLLGPSRPPGTLSMFGAWFLAAIALASILTYLNNSRDSGFLLLAALTANAAPFAWAGEPRRPFRERTNPRRAFIGVLVGLVILVSFPMVRGALGYEKEDAEYAASIVLGILLAAQVVWRLGLKPQLRQRYGLPSHQP